MNKLEELHLKSIESVFDDTNSLEMAEKSAEITTDVAIKFAEWLEENRYIRFDIFENQMSSTHYKYQKWDKSYKNSFEITESETKTTQELFEEFINNHYGK